MLGRVMSRKAIQIIQPCSWVDPPDVVAAEMAAEGASDRIVAERLGIDRMAARRHRINHVVAPAKALAAAANKGADVREQSEQALALAEQVDPSAFLALAGIVNDLKKVHDRLERTADAAEQDNQRLAGASLSSQQLRAAEARAKIGGVGAYSPQKQSGSRETPTFSITMIFGDRAERLDMTAAEPALGTTIDMPPGQPATTVVEIPDMRPDTSGEADAVFDEDL